MSKQPTHQPEAGYIPGLVAWGVPMMQTVYSRWFVNFMDLHPKPEEPFLWTIASVIIEARNRIHRRFLTATRAEWLVMLDSDVTPPPDFLPRLMAHNKPMVGGWYRMKDADNYPVVFDFAPTSSQWTQRKRPGKGLESIDGAGAGCWLMHRSVAEAIGPKPYASILGGEDLYMCAKVHSAGFDIWLDWSMECRHLGVYGY
jgi:hypothetical protein